jgi:hypothetical protein
MRTRYEGEKFLALPAGAPAPYAIKHHLDRTRIFVPLHVGSRQAQGSMVVKVYETGPFELDWALVEVPKLVANPEKKTDFAIGEELATQTTPLGSAISIISGNPTIVVRDSFSTETPKQSFRSNSGEFDLQVFEGYYRVIDARTGELLQERAGWDPNFSPTSRFLGAYSAGPGFEIVDLYAGKVVTSNDILLRERKFTGNISLAGWSEGDSFVGLSFQSFGGIEVLQSLVDGFHRSFPYTNCHYCRGINSSLRVDSEAGIISYKGADNGWESLFDRSTGGAAAASEALKRVPKQSWEEKDDVLSARKQAIQQRRSTFERQTSLAMINTVARNSFFKSGEFFKADPPSRDDDNTPVEDRWRFPDRMRVSHVCLRNDQDMCIGRLVDWQAKLTDLEEEDARIVKLRVAHKAASPTGAGENYTRVADARLITSRGRTPAPDSNRPPVSGPEAVWDQLATLLPPAREARTWRKLSAGSPVPVRENSEDVAARENDIRAKLLPNPQDQGTRTPLIGGILRPPVSPQTDGDNSGAVSRIVQTIPQAARFFRAWNWSKDYGDRELEEFWGVNKEAVVIASDMIEQYAQWSLADRKYFLVRSFFDNGASSRNWLFLVQGSGNRIARLQDFTHKLRYRVGSRPSGLDEHGKLETTAEFATTMGFGGWPGSLDKVSIAFDRYLLASGEWTVDNRRWLLMYDLRSEKLSFFNRDVPDASTETRFAITEDGTTIVQTNSNGHLYIYNVPDEKLVLSGLNIDDELVVYDSLGYYAASPEGAQFVFVKFPGLSGYNSLHQFSKILNQPDVISNVLPAGRADASDPRLNAPPKVGLETETNFSGGVRSVRLKVDVSSPIGLQQLKIFIDGRAVSEYPVTGNRGKVEANIALLPESRWIAAVAVDSAGYESVPQGRELAGARVATTSRLFGVAVGTDHYVDPYLETLPSAVADARKFGQALVDLSRGIYSAIDVETFLDSVDLRNNLLAKVREVAAKADERDTIMLFVAGHGFRSETTGQFFLAARESDPDRPQETMISWEEIAAAVDETRARVIVFIDACHSGAAGAANDEAISRFLGRKAPITLIAASKGRQLSLEHEATGGFFTKALVNAIGAERQATDVNGNGAIELAELYGAIKQQVVRETGYLQTPWIARNNMVGETPLF